MMSKSQGKEERPKVHSQTARSRSPTVTAAAFRQKKGLLESKSSTWSPVSHMDKSENPEQYFSKHQLPVGPDKNKEADFQNGDQIAVKIDYRDHDNLQHFVDIKVACTIEEYMHWTLILHTAVLLDQFNLDLKKERDISVSLTSDSVMHVGRNNKNVESIIQSCRHIITNELKSLSKTLDCIETDLHPDQIERYIVELGIPAQAKTLKGHVYFVFMKCDRKIVSEYIAKVVESCCTKEDSFQKQIITRRIWIKFAQLINLDHILKQHCKCRDLKVTLLPQEEKCNLLLTGPKRAVESAEMEFNNLHQRLHQEKCELSVTSKSALFELHIESFLDEHLLKYGIKCVTEQIKDKIFVYGLSLDCVKKAQREVEAVIVEKTSIIKGVLKQKKDLLIASLRNIWPRGIVIHVADSGFLHIVGVKVFVEDIHRRLNDISEGRISLEEIDSGEKDDSKTKNVVTMNHRDGQIEQTLTVNDDIDLSKDTLNNASSGHIHTDHCTAAGEKERECVKKELIKEPDLRCQSCKGEVWQQEVLDKFEITGHASIGKMSIVGVGASETSARDVRYTGDQVAPFKKKTEPLDRKFRQTLRDGNAESETSEIVNENMQFSDIKIKKFLVKHDAKVYLKECSEEYNVTICRQIHCDTVEKIKRIECLTVAPEKEITHRCTWETMDQKKMILAVSGGTGKNVTLASRAVSVVFGHHKRNKDSVSFLSNTDHRIVLKVRVPEYYNGKYQDREQLMETLKKLFDLLEEANAEHVILPLEAVHNWPSTEFIACVITKTVQALLFRQNSDRPYSVLLCVNDEILYESAFQCTCRCIKACIAAKKVKRNILQVVVVSGELDKIKADVIVNTTSRDLNLSNGKVSETLLKAAGSHIQRECSEKYPNGISRLEVAVTEGYRLYCENVFHIALDRYLPQKEMDSIETIRSLMMTCFKTASELGHKTIAFPAIGTGVLRYPSDLVASAMFESVERFRSDYPDTSLEQVVFVVYPSDDRVRKDFLKNEETLGKCLEEQGNRWYEIQLKITGTSEDVRRAKSDILDRCKDEMNSTSEICEDYLGVTRQDYVALCELHKKDIRRLEENGIHITHQPNKLTLTGKRKSLKKVRKQITEHLKDIHKYRCVSLSVKGYDRQLIEKLVDHENLSKSKKDFVCVFDKYYDIIRIFAMSASTETAVRNSLKDKLKHGPDGHYVYNKTSETVHAERKALEAPLSDFTECPETKRKEIVLPHELNGSYLFEKSMNVAEERKDITKNFDALSSHHSDSEEENVSAYKEHMIRKKYSQDEWVFNTNDILVRVHRKDILSADVDCIVCPANRDLKHCGKLASTIVKTAGDSLIKNCENFVKEGPLSVSKVVCTPSGQLKYKRILHAVAPCWSDYRPITEKSLKQCQDDLRQTVINCMKTADENGLYGVPIELCAIEYAKAIIEFCGKKTQSLSEVHIVDIDPDKIVRIQKTFTMMIDHGKPIMIDIKNYVEATASNDESADDTGTFKHTGRDKPKRLKDIDSKSVSEGEDTDHYSFMENKMVCRFSSSHLLLIYDKDIPPRQEVQAEVRCGNNSDVGKDAISEKLSGSIKKEYKAEGSEYVQSELWNTDIVTTDGDESCFQYIINVVTPKDGKAQHLMYIHVFDEVVRKGINSVSMPLLGIGDAEGHALKENVVVFLREWISFIHNCKSHSLTLHLVLNDKHTTDFVTDIVKDYFRDEVRFEEYLGKQEVFGANDEGIPDLSQDTLDSETVVVQELDCVICLDKIHTPKKLKCGHQFCKECIEGYFQVKPTCPVCGQICGVIIGDQPDGNMEIMKIKPSCAGYEECKSIAVSYFFPPGHQRECNPRPGAYYRSISRTGYLPDNKEGREVCALLKVAFERRLTFTIGTSRTTLEEGVITWNDIHHKTDLRPHTQFGYPDESYLQRVREEMEVKGITSEDIDKDFIKELEKDRYSCKVSTPTWRQ